MYIEPTRSWARPESQEIGVKSGVIDGEFHYLVPMGG